MPTAPPVLAPMEAPRRVRWLRPIGITLVIVGAVVVGVMALVLMVTVMSDPATPGVGLVPGPDGTLTAVVQRSGAQSVTEVLVQVSDTDRTVLWEIDRIPGSSWDGTVALGNARQGFTTRTALPGAPIPAGAVLVVTNGCYASYVTVPNGPLAPGVVTTTDGQHVSLDEFYRYGGAFTPCGNADLRIPLRMVRAGSFSWSPGSAHSSAACGAARCDPRGTGLRATSSLPPHVEP